MVPQRRRRRASVHRECWTHQRNHHSAPHPPARIARRARAPHRPLARRTPQGQGALLLRAGLAHTGSRRKPAQPNARHSHLLATGVRRAASGIKDRQPTRKVEGRAENLIPLGQDRVSARLLHKASKYAPEPLLMPIFYLQTAVFSSGPAWTRTRDLFLIREVTPACS